MNIVKHFFYNMYFVLYKDIPINQYLNLDKNILSEIDSKGLYYFFTKKKFNFIENKQSFIFDINNSFNKRSIYFSIGKPRTQDLIYNNDISYMNSKMDPNENLILFKIKTEDIYDTEIYFQKPKHIVKLIKKILNIRDTIVIKETFKARVEIGSFD